MSNKEGNVNIWKVVALTLVMWLGLAVMFPASALAIDPYPQVGVWNECSAYPIYTYKMFDQGAIVIGAQGIGGIVFLRIKF